MAFDEIKYIKVFNDATVYISPPQMLGYFTKKGITFEKNSLNKSACQMLEMAKKQISLDKIINNYLTLINKKNDQNFEKLFTFFQYLEEIGIIELVCEPFDNTGKIRGHYDKYYPKIMSFELVEKCNLFCSHCYNSSHSEKSLIMDAQKLRCLFEKLKINGLDIIQFTGGEPMLHPDFDEILEFSCHIFNSVCILTNGTLITDDFVNKFKKYNDKIKFSISLDNYLPEKHEKVRNSKGCFELTTKGVKKLREEDFYVRIGMTFDDTTIEDIIGTFDFSIKELHANHFVFNPILPYGRSYNCWHTVDETLISKITVALNHIENSPHKNRLMKPPKSEENPKNCGAGYKTFTVCADGVLKPCVLFPKNLCKIGNIFSDDMDLLFSYDNLRFFIDIDISRGKPECKNCDFNPKFCEGCLINTLSLAHKKQDCAWSKKNIELIKENCDQKYSYDFDIPEVKFS
ncbi:MAG TPA: radical SAM protein [Candidatus Deferrimicrobium sp.]|nr:radical SAM protein [Candidatus Deferrimicrobium sp.]